MHQDIGHRLVVSARISGPRRVNAASSSILIGPPKLSIVPNDSHVLEVNGTYSNMPKRLAEQEA